MSWPSVLPAGSFNSEVSPLKYLSHITIVVSSYENILSYLQLLEFISYPIQLIELSIVESRKTLDVLLEVSHNLLGHRK